MGSEVAGQASDADHRREPDIDLDRAKVRQ
jgi:hypothetical protein